MTESQAFLAKLLNVIIEKEDKLSRSEEVERAYLFPDIPKVSSYTERGYEMDEMKKLAHALAVDHVIRKNEMVKVAGTPDWLIKAKEFLKGLPGAARTGVTNTRMGLTNASLAKPWLLPTSGAVIGAGTGAAVSDDKLKGALLGAGLGAGAGAGGMAALEGSSLRNILRKKNLRGAALKNFLYKG